MEDNACDDGKSDKDKSSDENCKGAVETAPFILVDYSAAIAPVGH